VTCEEIRGLLSLYADGELDLVRQREIEQHLRECPVCAGVVERSRSLSKMLRDPALYARPPADLHKRVRLSLRQVAGARERDRWVSWRWGCLGGFAVVVALTVVALWDARPLKPAFSRDEAVGRLVISSHLHSVMLANYRHKLEPRDPQTVNPWVISNVGFVPEVRDLTEQGFPFLDCRLEYVAGRPAATLVYTRDMHVISVFVWRAEEREEDCPSEFLEKHGYYLIRWTDNGRLFWVISDLNKKELREFAELLRR